MRKSSLHNELPQNSGIKNVRIFLFVLWTKKIVFILQGEGEAKQLGTCVGFISWHGFTGTKKSPSCFKTKRSWCLDGDWYSMFFVYTRGPNCTFSPPTRKTFAELFFFTVRERCFFSPPGKLKLILNRKETYIFVCVSPDKHTYIFFSITR